MKKRPVYKKRRGKTNRSPDGQPVPVVPFRPRIDRRLLPVLEKIGAPKKRPFIPDPFQVEAVDKLGQGDVVVSAPTGSGKTWIALQAMEHVLAEGGRAWYASPLKALSNSKYIEFGQRFGPDKVGLLTGDHKVNPDAPLIVGTTEILRNQLYDAMSRGEDLAADLVVMDEAHYLGDPDRGVVWEEVVIYLDPRVRLLLLSATVANAQEIADWLTFVRGQTARTVISHQRPVPLHPLFLFPDGELTSLEKGPGLSPKVRHFLQQQQQKKLPRAGRWQPSFGRLLNALSEADLLPAIFFLKSRADCDLALQRCPGRTEYLGPEIRLRLEARLEALLERYPFLKSHPHLKYIRGPGVAAHHAGHMPHWKLLVETLMQEGLLAAIFSTSTVAAGVNFPARTVVITQSDIYNGHEFQDLSATQLLQMSGRAGRRGMDRIGFALIVPGPFQNVQLIHSLFNSPPDPVTSQIQINFSMVLNLLLSYTPAQIKQLLDLSLAAFQQGGSRQAAQIKELMDDLARLLQEGACGAGEEPEKALNLIRQTKRLKAESAHLSRQAPRLFWERALEVGLKPGRLFQVHSGAVYCVLEPKNRGGRPGVLAAKVKKDLGLKKGAVKDRWLARDRVAALLEARLDFSPDTKPAELVRLIREAAGKDHQALEVNALTWGPDDEDRLGLGAIEFRLERITQELESLPCTGCLVHNKCFDGQDREADQIIARLKKLESASRTSGLVLWISFLRHLDFLKAEGFVDRDETLTQDGQWAARLRLDHPLLMAEGIRAEAWPEGDPALLAALVAPFVMDKEREALTEEVHSVPSALAAPWPKLEKTLEPLMKQLLAHGFEVPRLNLRPALAIYAWATLGLWDEAVNLYGLDPGDMAMLVFRTADNLRQMAGLKETHPRLAAAARQAVELIMKEPVVVPL